MTINYEIKSQLAKLLATEDLIVENKKVETACFNVETRVLTLPMWEKASNHVYDLLVAHEVGHALFTPNIDWTEKLKINPMFVNIVEDVRIEKMMKRKYGGLSKTFYRGYEELNNDDFFSIKEKGVNEYGLADKVNLYFKIGNFVNINFSSKEIDIVKEIANAETFDEVLIAAEKLYKYCKDELEEQKNQSNSNSVESQNSSSGELDGNSEQSSEEGDDNQEDFDQTDEESDGQEMTLDEMLDEAQQRELANEPKVETMDSLDKKLKDLNDLMGEETQYIESPDIDLNNFIISNEVIHDQINDYFNVINDDQNNIFEFTDSKYKEFKKSAQKEVNYLVKEFECKKSADAYARSFTSRTGILDTSKLHTYKYNEDLFKKVSIIPDGKNHGLIFILDWSGSMSTCLMDTIKQLYNLVWFCQKVKIPFDVYAFSNAYKCVEYDDNGKSIYPKPHHKLEVGKFYVSDDVCLINLLTSGKKNNVLEKQMLNVWRNVSAMRYYCCYSPFHRLGLGGTPLNETLLSLHKVIPQFKDKHKIQKVQCVVLTDGEGGQLSTMKKVKKFYDGQEDIRPWRLTLNSFYRNRKTGYVYKIPSSSFEFTDMMLKDLRQTFTDTNFIGIRILSGSDFSRINRIYNGYDEQSVKAANTWKKQKSAVFYNSGYNAYFMLSTNALINDSEFEVSKNASKVQIKNAFQKSLKSKKMNKKILTEFVELVA